MLLKTSQSSTEGRLQVRIHLPDNTAKFPQKKTLCTITYFSFFLLFHHHHHHHLLLLLLLLLLFLLLLLLLLLLLKRCSSFWTLASNIIFLHFQRPLVITCLFFISLYLSRLHTGLSILYIVFLFSLLFPL